MPCLTCCNDNFLNTMVMLNYQHLTCHTLIVISVSFSGSGHESMEFWSQRCWGHLISRQEHKLTQHFFFFHFIFFLMFCYSNYLEFVMTFTIYKQMKKKNTINSIFIYFYLFATCNLFQEQDSCSSECLSQSMLASILLLLRLWPDTSLKSLSTLIWQQRVTHVSHLPVGLI